MKTTEWHATDYARESGLQKAMADKQLRSLVLRGDERILDVGCGDGKITAEIAARVPRGSVLGVDPSREMIAFAQKKFGIISPISPSPLVGEGRGEGAESTSGVSNLQFDVADVRQLTYRNEFDLVVSFNALHWVPEQETALRAIRAALKPSGRSMLRFVPEGPQKCLEDVIEETRQSSPWAAHFADFRRPYAHFTPDEYRELAGRAGFAVDRIDLEDGSWNFQTRAGFAAWSRATFAEWTKRLPENQWDAFIADVLDRYKPIADDDHEQPHTFKFYQLEVELTPKPE
jgi:trans-aconitate methyltransferase